MASRSYTAREAILSIQLRFLFVFFNNFHMEFQRALHQTAREDIYELLYDQYMSFICVIQRSVYLAPDLSKYLLIIYGTIKKDTALYTQQRAITKTTLGKKRYNNRKTCRRIFLVLTCLRCLAGSGTRRGWRNIGDTVTVKLRYNAVNSWWLQPQRKWQPWPRQYISYGCIYALF